MANNMRISPAELDQLEFYRVEYLMDNFKDFNDKKNQHHKEQEANQKDSFDQSSILKSSQNSFNKYLSSNKFKGLK